MDQAFHRQGETQLKIPFREELGTKVFFRLQYTKVHVEPVHRNPDFD